MNENEFKDFNKKVRAEGLIMSRVPTPTREEFVRLADEQFAGDYGMVLAHLLYNYKLFIIFINDFNMKLDNLLLRLDQIEQKKEGTEKKKIRLLSGKELNANTEVQNG
jgi:hypothetical protein